MLFCICQVVEVQLALRAWQKIIIIELSLPGMKKEFMGVKKPDDLDTLKKGLVDQEPGGRMPASKDGSPELTEVGEANINPDEVLENEFEEKYKEHHRSEFRTPERLTTEQVYDPTDELDVELDKKIARERGGYGLSSIEGPEGKFPKKQSYIPNNEWKNLSRSERISIYENRDKMKEEQKKIEESYIKNPLKRFVRKIFKKEKAA